MLQLITCNIALLVIAALYYTWRDGFQNRQKRVELHERVAYMLWTAAGRTS